jgi:hypothetical protein
VRDDDVAVLGIRDLDEALTELGELAVPVWEVTRLRADSPAGAARAALARLQREELDGFWCTWTPTSWTRA